MTGSLFARSFSPASPIKEIFRAVPIFPLQNFKQPALIGEFDHQSPKRFISRICLCAENDQTGFPENGRGGRGG